MLVITEKGDVFAATIRALSLNHPYLYSNTSLHFFIQVNCHTMSSITISTMDSGYDYHVKDRWGKAYHFKVLTFEVPSGLVSEALEVVSEFGREPYRFRVLNDYVAAIDECEDQLKAKIKRGINRRSLTYRDGMWEIGRSNTLCGRIEWGEDHSETSFDRYFVVDGKKITLEMFERMLDSYEGFDFTFSLKDSCD